MAVFTLKSNESDRRKSSLNEPSLQGNQRLQIQSIHCLVCCVSFVICFSTITSATSGWNCNVWFQWSWGYFRLSNGFVYILQKVGNLTVQYSFLQEHNKR